MAQDTETAVIPPTSEPVPSSAAEHMRLHRRRRRDGLRCVTILLRETEVDALTRKGFLKADARDDQDAVCEAPHQFFDHTLGPTS